MENTLERVRFQGNPVANPESIVAAGQARFTLLTERLLRMEWSETGQFEDHCTYAFPMRYGPAPEFSQEKDGKTLIIRTSALELRYLLDSGKFTPDNLSITVRYSSGSTTWRPGLKDPGNLRGTRRTLDGVLGDAALAEGLISQSGWALFDDSRSVVFNVEDGWVAPRPRFELQDWYFFGYGHNYKAALAEYTRFGGAIPVMPRFMLGAWWSRYWEYSQPELQELVQDFEANDLPLDVLVIDMDWHTPDRWTGYTWNRKLFPDPDGFLSWVHAKGLRTTLNLHPAEGVQPFEEIYPRFARAMDIDPAGKQAVPFRITDKKFVKNYFELLHHPLEEQGVDFWWMDWQQGESTEIEGLDPLPWLNHLHFADSARRGNRSMLYSRWGGLGNHRYPIGFSGDSIVGWSSLRFQPYMTATASNVAYGWWSHDIGGHMGEPTEPELYVRWVQFGALSPCLRLHSTKDARLERRPWKYPPAAYQAARAAFHWRYRNIPYIYTMSRVAFETGLSLCRPMYYEYPEDPNAYAARFQYFFGDQMIAAPVVYPANPESGLAASDVWVPQGDWIDAATHEIFRGPRWVRMLAGLERMPILMKAGAIVPQAPAFGPQTAPRMASGTSDALSRDQLVLSFWPGQEGRFRYYEDDGLTPAYLAGEYEWTEISSHMARSDRWEIRIAPSEGYCPALPAGRSYEIRLEASLRPDKILVDGSEVTDWTYDSEFRVTSLCIPHRDKRQETRITVLGKEGLSAAGPRRDQEAILADMQRILGNKLPKGEADFESLLESAAAVAGNSTRQDAIARLGGPFFHILECVTPEEASRQLGRVIVGAPSTAEPFDLEIEFALHRPGTGQPQVFKVKQQDVQQSQIIDTPFAFDGQPQPMYWTAHVRLVWRGHSVEQDFRSNLIFPAIFAWQGLFFDPTQGSISPEEVMDASGRINLGLNWTPYAQNVDRLTNLNVPYSIHLAREFKEQAMQGKPVAGYLATTIVSLEEQDALLFFQGDGELDFYLNGQKLPEAEEAGPDSQRFQYISWLRALRQIRLHLKQGENSLVLSTRPLPEKPRAWYFGGMLASPEGEWMPGLLIKAIA